MESDPISIFCINHPLMSSRNIKFFARFLYGKDIIFIIRKTNIGNRTPFNFLYVYI